MAHNKNLHKLLNIFYSNGDYPDHGDDVIFGSFSHDELKDLLKLPKLEVALLLRNLVDNNELEKVEVDTFIISHLGMKAFVTGKYIKLYRKAIIDNLKDIASIIVPILSLTVAILAISIKLNSPSKEDFEVLQKKVEKLEKEYKK
ncbi:hypothetical protein [Flavobacterium aquidurense]|uniref:hypothetical protein n=1 Tax=Flavobacterium aquidurense TaxID=362413 RepID=UPI0006D82B59|nr:hypothetical protein [Flavobacterium aquidurense]